MNENERYEIKDPELIELTKRLGHLIGANLPKNWGFGLFLFEFGEKKDLFYISSAAREDMVNVLQEWIQKQVQ